MAMLCTDTSTTWKEVVSTVSVKVKVSKPLSRSKSKSTSTGGVVSSVKLATIIPFPSSTGSTLLPFMSTTVKFSKVINVLLPSGRLARPLIRLISFKSSKLSVI